MTFDKLVSLLWANQNSLMFLSILLPYLWLATTLVYDVIKGGNLFMTSLRDCTTHCHGKSGNTEDVISDCYKDGLLVAFPLQIMSLAHQRRILKQVYDEFLKGRTYSRLCVKNISTGHFQNLRLRVATNIHPDCVFSGGTNSLTLPFCCRYSSYAATGSVRKTRPDVAFSNFSNTNTRSIVSVSDLDTSGKFNRSLFPINCFQKHYISKSKPFSTTTSSMASSSISSDHQEDSNVNRSEHHYKYMVSNMISWDI